MVPGSVNAIGSTISAISGGFMIDKFGRRPTAFVATIPPTIGWLFISFGYSSTFLLIGRMLTGFTNGIAYISQVYAAECIFVNHTHLRNHLNAWPLIVNALGQLLNYGLSVVMPYQNVALVATAIGVTASLSIYFCIPESPEWLHKKGRLKEARHSEARLCIYQPILGSNDEPSDSSCANGPPTMSVTTGFRLLKRKDVYKPVCIMTAWFALIIFSGGSLLLSYMVDLLKTTSDSEASSYWKTDGGTQRPGTTSSQSGTSSGNEYELSVMSGILTLVAVILMSCVITRIGVKWTAMSSSFCMALGWTAYGVSQLRSENWQNILNVIHVVSIWVAVFFYSFGGITAALSVVAEMFAHDVKGFASVTTIAMGVFAALAVKAHLYLNAYFGAMLYFYYAFLNLVTVMYIAVFVPETVGKTIDEIAERFLK